MIITIDDQRLYQIAAQVQERMKSYREGEVVPSVSAFAEAIGTILMAKVEDTLLDPSAWTADFHERQELETTARLKQQLADHDAQQEGQQVTAKHCIAA